MVLAFKLRPRLNDRAFETGQGAFSLSGEYREGGGHNWFLVPALLADAFLVKIVSQYIDVEGQTQERPMTKFYHQTKNKDRIFGLRPRSRTGYLRQGQGAFSCSRRSRGANEVMHQFCYQDQWLKYPKGGAGSHFWDWPPRPGSHDMRCRIS